MSTEGEVIDAEYEVTGAMTQQDSLAVIPTAVEAMVKAECMTQVDVARRYPRSVAHFKNTLKTLAMSSKDIAAKCFYTLPARGDSKPVTGPSIRMAEMMGASWGHLSIKTRLVEIGDRTVTVEARVWDMQNNVAHSEEFVAPIVGSAKFGSKRYSDDMIGVTIRAAQAKARRNAILAVVPRAYYEEIKTEIMLVAAGKGQDLKTAIATAMKWWKDQYGVTEQQCLDTLRRDSIDLLTIEDVSFLRGFATAVKEGSTKLEDVFKPAQSKAADLSERLKKRDEKPAEEAPPAEEKPEAGEKKKKG